MSSFRIRPRFTQIVDQVPAEVRTQILGSLREHSPELELKDFPGFIGIHIPEKDRRSWLFLSLYETETGGTRIEGTYGPEIEVWSVFLYGYLVTGLLGTFSGILGGAQLFIGTKPWGFWVTGAMAAGAIALYLFAQFGQKLGAGQTFQLHQAYEKAMGGPVGIR
jgi:hypothetical protein